MDNSIITAIVVAFVLGLIKAIDWLVSRKNKKESYNFSEIHAAQLEKTSNTVLDIQNSIFRMLENGTLTKEDEELLEQIHKMIEHLNELHSVYDNNHVPKWYVPSDLSERLIKIDSRSEIISERFEEIKDSQNELVQKISDLILSQNRVTDRLGDLINILGKQRN